MAAGPSHNPAAPVPLSELVCAEYCFNAYPNPGLKRKEERGVDDIKRITAALLNSYGGRIYLCKPRDSDICAVKLEDWMLQLEEQLTAFIPQDVYRNCVSYSSVGTGGHVFKVIIVKRSPKLITLQYHLQMRQVAGNMTVSDSQCALNIIQAITAREQRHNEELPFPCPKSFTYKQKLGYSEGPNLEFKYWKPITGFEGYQARFLADRIQNTLFAFANGPSGGDLVIGVTKEIHPGSYTVVGQIISRRDQEKLEIFLSELLDKNGDATRIWSTPGKRCRNGVDWYVQFVPVRRCPVGTERYVIKIRVNYFPGGVFKDLPTSFFVSEEGRIQQMSFGEWKRNLFHLAVMPPSQPEISSDRLGSPDHGHVMLRHGRREMDLAKCKDLDVTPRARLSGHESDYKRAIGVEEQDQKDKLPEVVASRVGSALKYKQYVSLSENMPTWRTNLKECPMDLTNNIDDFIENTNLTTPQKPTVFTPNRMTILACYPSYHHTLSAVFSKIDSSMNYEAFAFVTSCWLSMFENTIEYTKPSHHLMDIFIMDSTGAIDLRVIFETFDTTDQRNEQWKYVMNCARTTRAVLLRTSGISGHTLQCPCSVYYLNKTHCDTQSARDPLLQEPSASFRTLRRALVTMVMGKGTTIKNMFDNQRSIYATSQQMERLIQCGLRKFSIIEGPPGSGKTYMGLHLASSFGKSKTSFICTTLPMQKHLEYQGIHHPILAKESGDIRRCIESKVFRTKECVIIDDAQRLNWSYSTWLHLFQHISDETKAKLVIFADSKYQYFDTKTNFQQLLKDLVGHFMESDLNFSGYQRLNQIHRNHRKIVSFVKSCIDSDGDIMSSAKTDGDDVEFRHVSNTLDKSANNGLLYLLQQLVNSHECIAGYPQKYAPSDIAVLLDVSDEVAENMIGTILDVLNRYFPICKAQRATLFPVGGIVVDTLDNFTGLEAQVCVCLFFCQRGDVCRTIVNPRYKAFIASRAITKVVFAVASDMNTYSLEHCLANDQPLKDVKLDFKEIRLKSEHHRVRDVTFITIASDPAVLYSEDSADGRSCTMQLRSTKGDCLPVPLKLSTNTQPRRVAVSPTHQHLVVGEAEDWNRNQLRTWSVYTINKKHEWELKARHQIDIYIWSFAIADDGDTVILGYPIRIDTLVPRLRKYTKEGCLVWDRGSNDTHICGPWSLTVDRRGTIYVTDLMVGCIRVLGPCSEYKKNIYCKHITRPLAVCVCSSGDWLFVSHGDVDSHNISMLSTDGCNRKHVAQISQYVNCLSLYDDTYLLLGMDTNLLIYDVSILLSA